MTALTGNGWTMDAANIPLKRLGGDEPAGLWITSLPWPRMPVQPLALGGAATYCRPLGRWPEAPEGTPRRLLLVADGANQAPASLCLGVAGARPSGPLPEAESECFAKSPEPFFGWERHRLRLRRNGRSIAIAMGLRTGTEWHWWEACRMVVREETPACRPTPAGAGGRTAGNP